MQNWLFITLLAFAIVIAFSCVWFAYRGLLSIRNSLVDEVYTLSKHMNDSFMQRLNHIEARLMDNFYSTKKLLDGMEDFKSLPVSTMSMPLMDEPFQLAELSPPKQTQEKRPANRYDIFLSYSSRDREEADQIYQEVKSAGGEIFLAEKSLRPGEDFADEIRKALNDSQEIWLLVSPSSLKSDWVVSEWGAAWVLGKKIVPILHRCDIDGLPERIGRFHCIDFYKCPDIIKDKFAGNRSK